MKKEDLQHINYLVVFFLVVTTMKYHVNYDQPATCVFMYKRHGETLEGIDVKYTWSIQELRSKTLRQFSTQPTKNLEEKLKIVYAALRKKDWACLEVEGEETLSDGIDYHGLRIQKALRTILPN
jgi:hypothetical protein